MVGVAAGEGVMVVLVMVEFGVAAWVGVLAVAGVMLTARRDGE